MRSSVQTIYSQIIPEIMNCCHFSNTTYTKLYNQMYVYTTALVKIDGAAKGLKQYIF